MYTDFSHFFTVTTRNVCHIKLPQPPHLYYVTNYLAKLNTAANINAIFGLIDVNGPSVTLKEKYAT